MRISTKEKIANALQQILLRKFFSAFDNQLSEIMSGYRMDD